jgi:hypothetical protein
MTRIEDTMPAERKLIRKNLMVDNDRIKALAHLRGTSESEAVRDAVDFVLAAEEIVAAIRDLHALGGVDDVFGRMPEEGAKHAAPPGSGHD